MTLRLAFDSPAPPDRVALTHYDQASVMSDLTARLAQGRGFSLATLNLDHLVKLGRGDAEGLSFMKAYLRQTHIVADGNPVVWFHRLAGRSNVELVPGSDLLQPLCAAATAMGVPVALMGTTEDTLAAAAERLEAQHPGLRVVMRHAPSMGFDPEGASAERAVEALAAAGPAGLCFLALGAPRQERFAAFAAPRLPGWGFASVGAGIDFVTGRQRRAPAWVRRIAMEWAWRMLGDPRRLVPRYAACFAVLPGLAVLALSARREGSGSVSSHPS